MNDRSLAHTAAAMDRLFNALAKPARRVAENPQDFPEKPDLAAELEACADQLEHCASLIELGYPATSQAALVHARRARAKAAQAREFGHA